MRSNLVILVSIENLILYKTCVYVEINHESLIMAPNEQ